MAALGRKVGVGHQIVWASGPDFARVAASIGSASVPISGMGRVEGWVGEVDTLRGGGQLVLLASIHTESDDSGAQCVGEGITMS